MARRRELSGSRSGRPPALSSIGKMLHNPFFYGVFIHKGEELHQGVHVPMISKRVFDDIQTALVAVGKPRKGKADKGFLFTNFATCGSCGYSICGERHVKKSGVRFDYYRCSHKSKRQRCDNRVFIRQEKFAAEVKRNVVLVTIPEEWKEKFLARIKTWQGQESKTRQEHANRLKADLAEVKSKIDRINNGFADGSLDIQEFKELKNPLVPRKTELEQQIAALERGGANRLEPLTKWVLEANQAETWARQNNWLEMKSFLQKVGSNRLLRGETLTVAFKKPHVSLAETNLAVRSTVNVATRNSRWWSQRDLNPLTPTNAIVVLYQLASTTPSGAARNLKNRAPLCQNKLRAVFRNG